MLVTMSVSILLCLLKVVMSKKMTISLVSMEFVGASMLVFILVWASPSSPVAVTALLITMFVCEGVLGLGLLVTPLINGGTSPRDLSSVLF